MTDPNVRIKQLEDALREILSPPDDTKGEYYGCNSLHEARHIAADALKRDDEPL